MQPQRSLRSSDFHKRILLKSQGLESSLSPYLCGTLLLQQTTFPGPFSHDLGSSSAYSAPGAPLSLPHRQTRGKEWTVGRGQPNSHTPSGRPLLRGGQEPSEPESATRARHLHGRRVSCPAVPTREPDPRAGPGLRGSARMPESRLGAARGREGAAGWAPPRLVPLPRAACHSRIFTRRWSRRAVAACRASRRRYSAAVRRPRAAACPSSSPKMSPAQRDRSASCSIRQTRACELT